MWLFIPYTLGYKYNKSFSVYFSGSRWINVKMKKWSFQVWCLKIVNYVPFFSRKINRNISWQFCMIYFGMGELYYRKCQKILLIRTPLKNKAWWDKIHQLESSSQYWAIPIPNQMLIFQAYQFNVSPGNWKIIPEKCTYIRKARFIFSCSVSRQARVCWVGYVLIWTLES